MSVQHAFQPFNGHHTPKSAAKSSTAIPRPIDARAVNLGPARKANARGRGWGAANWLAGKSEIKRSISNAMLVFGVSRPYIVAALSGGATACARRKQAVELAHAFDRATPEQQELFVSTHERVLLRLLTDRIIASTNATYGGSATNGHASAGAADVQDNLFI